MLNKHGLLVPEKNKKENFVTGCLAWQRICVKSFLAIHLFSPGLEETAVKFPHNLAGKGNLYLVEALVFRFHLAPA